jgi:release factor glutamine methyltransferase
MQTVKKALELYFQEHQTVLDQNYPGLGLRRLLEEFCDYTKLDENDEVKLADHAFIKMLEEGKPLEYINQKSHFYRSAFYVDERVLIPRSETEILVEDAVNYINSLKQESVKVAEVGVGSFALGLSVLIDAKTPINFWGGDISEDALAVARINLENLKTEFKQSHEVDLILSDRLKETDEVFDLIVSNPPYIRKGVDKEGVHHQAHEFEPHVALYLEDKEFDQWFHDFFQMISHRVHKTGLFLMEGHEDSLLQLQEFALKYFNRVELKKDYTGRLRFLHGYK